MKFYEVMSQIVLTSHLVGYDLLTISKTAWDAMTPEQQEKVQAAATAAIDWSQAEHLKMEAELAKSFEEKGLKVYEPDVAAFRDYAQKMYLDVRPREELARGDARQDQRPRRLTPMAGATRWRSGSTASPSSSLAMLLAGDVPRLPRADRLPLPASTSRSAGPRSSPSSPGSGWCSGAPPSSSPRPRRSAST